METPVSTQWIDQYLGISDIDNPSFEEVRNFMILWNLFESLLFQGSYSNLKAIHKSQSLQLDKQLITDTITLSDCHMHSISAHYISVHQKFINKQQPC